MRILSKVLKFLNYLWGKVSDFFKDLVNFIKKIWIYRKILWNDRDFDWAFIVSMLILKLDRTRNHILEHNLIESAQEVYDQISYVIERLERIASNSREDEALEALHTKYGVTFDFKGGRFNCRVSKGTEEDYNREFREWADKSAELNQQDLDEAFSYMAKYLKTWWD
jgi:hypothetical protein